MNLIPPDTSLVLHIGRHKCGTTSLQHFLHVNRAGLETAGYRYCEAPDIQHHAVARYLQELGKPETERQFTAEMTEGYELFLRERSRSRLPLLLSSEGLQKVDPQNLSAEFGDSRTTVIVYLREQAEYFVSAYCQRVHAGKITLSLEEFADRPNVLGYDEFLQRWAARFGQSNMNVRIYDRERLVGGDIVNDFMSILGLQAGCFQQSAAREHNPSIGGNLLRFKLLLNATSIDETELLRMTYGRLSQIARDHPHFRERPQLDSQWIRDVRQKHVASNEIVRQEYFPDSSELFAPKPIDSGKPSYADRNFEDDIRQILEIIATHDAVLKDRLVHHLIQDGVLDAHLRPLTDLPRSAI